MSVFETLNNINVNEHTEEKNNLTYLPWAWAWAEVKKLYPTAFYTIYENANGWNYFTDGKTCWVKTGVTIEGLEHIEYLAVMDFRNKSILQKDVTSVDINRSIQRSLTKACARHGLGLYVYAGEDLPENEQSDKSEPQGDFCCESCGTPFKDTTIKGKKITAEQQFMLAVQNRGKAICKKCFDAMKAAQNES